MESNRAFRFSRPDPAAESLLGPRRYRACQPIDCHPVECPRRLPNLATRPLLSSLSSSSSLIHRSSKGSHRTEVQRRKLRSKADRFSRRKAIRRSNRKHPPPVIRQLPLSSHRHRCLSRERPTRPPPPRSNPKATPPRANSPRRSNRRRRIRLSPCHSSLCRLLHRPQLNRKLQHLSNRNSRRRQRGAEFQRSLPCQANRVLPRHRRADRPPLPNSRRLRNSVRLHRVPPRLNVGRRPRRRAPQERQLPQRRASRRAANVRRSARPRSLPRLNRPSRPRDLARVPRFCALRSLFGRFRPSHLFRTRPGRRRTPRPSTRMAVSTFAHKDAFTPSGKTRARRRSNGST